MTTLADMTLRVARRVATVLDGTATGGSATTMIDADRILEPTGTYDEGMLWFLSGSHAGEVVELITSHVANTLNFPSLASVLCVLQVETLTVVGTCTGNGNATVVVTAAGMTGSPKTLSVALLAATHTTATLVAGAVRTALAADADISAFFTIGGTGADVTLTAKRAKANDITMSVTIANGSCTGLTSGTSANTTAGVAGPRYALAQQGIPYTQLVAGINQAQKDHCKVTTEEKPATLLGDGSTLFFTLPTGVHDVQDILIERPGDTDGRWPKLHWEELNGGLRFDNGFALRDGEIPHLFYLAPPTDLSAATDVIDDEIDSDWLAAQAALNVLLNLTVDDVDYDLQERKQLVNQELQALSPVKHVRVRVHSAGVLD